MTRKKYWELRAREWDERLPELAKAMRSEDLQNSCADIEKYWGWIRCTTKMPNVETPVWVTDGTGVGIGKIYLEDGKEQWGIITLTEMDSPIAWSYIQYPPPELKQDCNGQISDTTAEGQG